MVGRIPGPDQLLPGDDRQRARRNPARGRRRRPRAPLAARAVAVAGRDERLAHLEADPSAEATSGQRKVRHLRQGRRSVTWADSLGARPPHLRSRRYDRWLPADRRQRRRARCGAARLLVPTKARNAPSGAQAEWTSSPGPEVSLVALPPSHESMKIRQPLFVCRSNARWLPSGDHDGYPSGACVRVIRRLRPAASTP